MNEKTRRFAERYGRSNTTPKEVLSMVDRVGELFYGQRGWQRMVRRSRRRAMMEKFLQNTIMLCVAAAAVIGVIALVRWVF